MPLNFDKHAQKGNEFINRLAEELGDKKNKAEAGKILRAVFKTLRGHLTLAENFQLLSQLPIALKGLYVDGWMPTHEHEITRKKIDFIEEVLAYEDKNKWPRFEDVENATKAVRSVFKTLKKYISQGEFENVIAILPKELKQLVKSSIYSKKLKVQLISE